MYRYRFLLSLLLLFFCSPAESVPVRLEENGELLFLMESRLLEIDNVQGRFLQVDPYDEETRGSFFLQRPGKLRFDYDPPHPFLIVSDGYWLGVSNRGERRTEKYPLSQTPLTLILDDKPDLFSRVRLLYLEEVEGIFELALEDPKAENSGRILLHFSVEDLSFLGWTVVDAQGLVTQIYLSDFLWNQNFDKRLFRIPQYLEIEHTR